MSDLIKLAQALIQRPSVTPDDAGCQELIGNFLRELGFTVESIPVGDVSNLWAYQSLDKPLLVFAGHTDVVPVGNESDWQYPPFAGTIADGKLHGRGAADMKSSLAAMLIAVKNFINKVEQPSGYTGFIITSDEEGPAIDGTAKVVELLRQRDIRPDFCIVGEPTSQQQLGDTIKIGRRGSLNGILKVEGKQGHIAYPQLANNPIPIASRIVSDLYAIDWQDDHPDFPATQFQVSNYQAGTGATNVVPADCYLMFNIRFSPQLDKNKIEKRVIEVIESHASSYQLEWLPHAKPFCSTQGKLVSACQQVIQNQLNQTPELSTSGGTSDARFIAELCDEVIELGPSNATIHQVDEHVSIEELEQLAASYEGILNALLS